MSEVPKDEDPFYVPNTIRRSGVYYTCVDIDGKTVRRSLGTRDPVIAREAIKKWLGEHSPRHASEALTFAEVASSWIETYQKDYTAKTWARYRVSLKMLKPFFGDRLWEEVNRATINQFIAERRKAGATAATVNRDLAVLSNIFHHAVDQEWSEENPVLQLSRRRRREKRQPFTLPPDEMIEAPFARMRTTFGKICRLALLTGMRRDELRYLDWRKNVVLERRIIQLFQTKTHRVRVIPLCDEAYELLRGMPRREGLVFLNRNGGEYQRITEMWREVQNRTAEKWATQFPTQSFIRFRFHDLRHIFAIRYLRNSLGSLYDLQLIMGHSTIRQTEEYLQYLTPEEAARVKQATQLPTHSAPVLQVVNG